MPDLGLQQEAERLARQWCANCSCHLDDPEHKYIYPDCEMSLRDSTPDEDQFVLGKLAGFKAAAESRDQRIKELEHQYAEYDAATHRVIDEQNAVIESRDQRISQMEGALDKVQEEWGLEATLLLAVKDAPPVALSEEEG